MTDPTQALRQCASQLHRAQTRAAELEHASRSGWAKVTELDKENQMLRVENERLWKEREEPHRTAGLYISECNRLEKERDELLEALRFIQANSVEGGAFNKVASAAIAKVQSPWPR